MWDLPRPRLEPVSPALAGRFSTTVPPGKPQLTLNKDGKIKTRQNKKRKKKKKPEIMIMLIFGEKEGGMKKGVFIVWIILYFLT